MDIEIRFHRPKFSRTAVRGHVEGGLDPSVETPVSWPTARDAMGERGRRGWFESTLVPGYIVDLLWARFHFGETGLYFLGHGPGHGVAHDDYVASEGVCNSEGMINHIHLHEYFANPVAQFELGLAAVRCWSRALREIDGLEKAVIYLHCWGRFSNYWIMCPYSQLALSGLDRVDQRIGGLERLPLDDFLAWAGK